MKIFLGTHDIALYLTGLAEGFKNLGISTTTYVTHRNKFSRDLNYDFVGVGNFIDKIYLSDNIFCPKWFKEGLLIFGKLYIKIFKKSFFEKIIKEHDIFIFIWEPWIHESLLFKKLKEKNKKIICVHLGSDVRHYETFCQEFNIPLDFFPKKHLGKLNEKLKKIRYQELYADLIFSVPDQAGLLIAPFYHAFLPFNTSKKIQFKLPDNEIPKIIHIPSNPRIKGSNFFFQIIEKLKNEGYIFEFEHFKNIPNEELLHKLSNADILLDELNLNGPGMLGLEAMASGCVVVTKCLENENFSPPIVSVNYDNLYTKLKEIILNKDLRIKLALEGIRFISENNYPDKICLNILDTLNHSNNSKFYTSNFFIDSFQLANTKLTNEVKELNKLVLLKYSKLDDQNKHNFIKKGIIL